MGRKIKKMDEWENEYCKVVILGDVDTNGAEYAEGHITYKVKPADASTQE